jgi:hypothetical protein
LIGKGAPLSGTYNGKKAFLVGVLSVLRGALKPDLWNVMVTNVIAGGNQAATELTVKSEARPTNPIANSIGKEWCYILEQIMLDHRIRRE